MLVNRRAGWCYTSPTVLTRDTPLALRVVPQDNEDGSGGIGALMGGDE
jgi:hypothetical protein